MNFATMMFNLVAFTALLATSFDSASAAERTAEQLLTNGEIQLAVSSAAECKKINFATSSQAEVCADAECLDVIAKAVKKFESCTISGMNMKDTLEVAIAGCKVSSSSTSATTTTTTTTSAPATSAAAAVDAIPTPSLGATSMSTSAISVAAASIVAVYAVRM